MKTGFKSEIRSAGLAQRVQPKPKSGLFPWRETPPESLMDLSLASLSPEALASLRKTSKEWMNSFEFSTQYAQPSATHAWIRLDEHAHVSKVCFFLEGPWKGVLKRVHIFGPTYMTHDEIVLLLHARNAAVATITCMESQHAAAWDGPWHRCARKVFNEDIVVDLPRSEADYLHALGRNAQKQLPYYLRRLRKELGPGFKVRYAAGSEISFEAFQALVELNRGRIERKGAAHLWHSELIEQRWKLGQECGLLCSIHDGDKLLAGTVSYVHRNEAYFVLIGHHIDYDRLRLGKLVLWLTIQRLIQRGFARYHLLWGRSFYKLQLGGRPQTLWEVTVFRHRKAALLWHAEQGRQALVRYALRIVRLPQIIMRRMVSMLRASSASIGHV